MLRRHFLQLLAASPLVAGDSPEYRKVRAALAGRKLYIVPYSHIDWAWSHSREWQAERAALSVAEALDLLKTIPEYRFFVDTWNEMVEPFADRHPERIADFRQAVKSGRMAICGGTVCNQHPSWMGQESLLRDMILGRRLFERLVPGWKPEVLAHFDVTPGPSQMPQIARKAGYFAFRTDRPDVAMTAEKVPYNFVWRGPDGSEVMVSRGPYTGMRDNLSFPNFREDWEGAVTRFYRSEVAHYAEPRGGGEIWIPMGSDDVRPLRSAVPAGDGTEGLMPVPEFIRKWNEREEAKLHFATPVEYFRELEKEAASLPRHVGVLEPTLWTYLYGTGGDQGLRLWRARCERALLSAESLLSCCFAMGDAYPAEQIESLWHDLLRAFSHAQTVLFTDDYAEHLELVKKTYSIAEDLRGQAMKKIAGRVKVQTNRPCVLLFNDLPWDRTEVVRIWPTMPPGGASNVEVRDARGETIPHQVIDTNYYRLIPSARAAHLGGMPFKETNLLVRVRVPALGYTTVYVDPVEGAIEKPETASAGNRLETDFADLEWSDHGIEFLLDKVAGVRYAGLGNVSYREVEVIDDFRLGAVKGTLRWENVKTEAIVRGPLRSSVTLKGPIGPHFVRLTAHLYPHARRVSFETEIETPGGSGFFLASTGLPEKGVLTADAHFAVEPRDLSKISWEGGERTFQNVFYGSHWADHSGARNGIAFLTTTGEKGFQFQPDANVLEHFLLKLFPAGNRSWWRFTTPVAEGVGRHSFDYEFLLHQGDWKSGDVVRRAAEARHPILTAYHDHAGEQPLPEEKTFLKLAPATVQPSAFYRDGNRYIARVYECSGAAARVSLDLPFVVKAARETNFHGEPREKKIVMGKHSVQFEITPWEIVTIELS